MQMRAIKQESANIDPVGNEASKSLNHDAPCSLGARMHCAENAMGKSPCRTGTNTQKHHRIPPSVEPPFICPL